MQAHEDRLKIERYAAGLGSAGEVLRGGLSEAVQRGVVTQDFVKTARGYDALTAITSDGGHQSVTTKEGASLPEWKHGASQLTVEQGMEAAKAANQPWDSRSVQDRSQLQRHAGGVARYNDMLTEFADEHMAMAGYITSKETVREAEKQGAGEGRRVDGLSAREGAVDAEERRGEHASREGSYRQGDGLPRLRVLAAVCWPRRRLGPTPDQIPRRPSSDGPACRRGPSAPTADAARDGRRGRLSQPEEAVCTVQEQNNVKAQISNIPF